MLTDEQRAALRSRLPRNGMEIDADTDAVLADAYRLGMLHAAEVCDRKVKRDPEYGGRFGGYGSFMGDMTGPECAHAIRAEAGEPTDTPPP